MKESKDTEQKFNLKEVLGEWYNLLNDLFTSNYFLNIPFQIVETSRNANVLPKKKDVFRAFSITQPKDVKVVILGQDPYPNPNHPIGLAFGINENNLNIPQSLRNILKELEDEYGFNSPDFDYSLQSWAKQGVLLLNTALTVQERLPGSHTKIWKPFTTEVIKGINDNLDEIVWLMWGNHAKAFKQYINNETHRIVECAHPSPLSAYKGFFGSNCFKEVDLELINLKKTKIEWLTRK